MQTALDSYGRLDIIVNNAGYTWDNVIQKTSDEQWYAMLDVHLTAPFRILRAASEYIRSAAKAEAAAGTPVVRKVVNVSSISGVLGNAGQIGYAAGKAGINGMTKTLAKEWGRYQVTVNSVGFGLIKTRLTETAADAPGTIDIEGRADQGRGQPGTAGRDRAVDSPRPRRNPCATARARSTCSASQNRTTSPARYCCAPGAPRSERARSEEGGTAP